MTVRVGVIGAGVMGADHARILARRVAGAELAALFDPDRDRAAAVADETVARHRPESAEALIAHPDVDAVLVASPDHTHPRLVLACLEAGKPVLCEKPLAPTSAECLQVIAAEAAGGRRLVQVGFMRRFDPAYLAMKQALDAGAVGSPRFFHSVHRNASAPPWFTSEMVITNSAVHDIDIARWLLGTEMRSAAVFAAPAQQGTLRDPQLVVLRAEADVLVTIEVYINAAYGYDIRGEVVGEAGAVTLSPPDHVHLRQAGAESFRFAPDWRPRFATAYHNQLQAWVNALRNGGPPVGASAWDGYVATAVAEACLAALSGGGEVRIELEKRPAFYG